MSDADAMQAARSALLEAALLGYFAEVCLQGFDGMSVLVSKDEDGIPTVELTFTIKGVAVRGQSL
jgi:hypothetical protein